MRRDRRRRPQCREGRFGGWFGFVWFAWNEELESGTAAPGKRGMEYIKPSQNVSEKTTLSFHSPPFMPKPPPFVIRRRELNLCFERLCCI
jgi:hypothetical protein